MSTITQTKGLTPEQVNQRILEGKINRVKDTLSRSYGEIIKNHIFTYFNFIHLVLFILVVLTGQIQNGLFMITILFNAMIGILNEIKAKRIIDELTILVVDEVETLRDEKWIKVRSDDLVLDDVIKLKTAMQVPCDCELLEGYLEVDESILTGESLSIEKNPHDTLYGASNVVSGEGVVKVIHVGKDNYSETIMKDAKKYIPARSIIQRDLTRLLRFISFVIVPIGILLFLLQSQVMHLLWQESTLKTVSALIGMIPEGLVVLTSIALSISVIRLSQKNVLVQDLYSIESLARVDIVCVDKTGTLTEGKMRVLEVIPMNHHSLEEIQNIMGNYLRVLSDSNMTSNALHDYFPLKDTLQESSVEPFSSARKYSAVTFEEGIYRLGAYEYIIHEENEEDHKKMNAYLDKGNRVIVLAKEEEVIALIVLEDIIRENAKEIMGYLTRQGVRIKVISGDHPKTVSNIAKKVNIADADKYVDLSSHQEEDMTNLVQENTIFGRVLPEQKKQMVVALQKLGHTVAMIGDGVNDVPALKLADVGVSVKNGSSAAKNSANIILLNNDFGDFPPIINEGRRVINNISRAASMYLVKTVFSILLSLLVILVLKPYVFLPIHLTLLSAFAVGIPTLILQLEPSFERIQGDFFVNALRHSIPTSLTIFIVSFGLVLSGIDTNRMYGMLILFSAIAYFYTLYKVYRPMNLLKRSVIGIMMIVFVFVVFFFQKYLEITFVSSDFLYYGIGILVVPLLMMSLTYLYDVAVKGYRSIMKKV